MTFLLYQAIKKRLIPAFFACTWCCSEWPQCHNCKLTWHKLCCHWLLSCWWNSSRANLANREQIEAKVSLSEVSSALGPGVCKALPGMHAFTGCDSTSAFAGKVKKGSIWFTNERSYWCHVFARPWVICDRKIGQQDVEKWECCMYSRIAVTDVNELMSPFLQ